MPSILVKWALTLTAISPACGAAAIVAFTTYGSWLWGVVFIIVGVLLACISKLVILFVEKHVERERLEVVEIERADQKVLEFLIAYLLPVFPSTNLANMATSITLTVYTLAVVALLIVHGNVFQFNPVLSMFGYHFLIVKSDLKISYLLITTEDYHKAERSFVVKKIADFVYLDVGK